MGTRDGYLQSVGDGVARALTGARAEVRPEGGPSVARLGVVASSSGGYYTVNLVGTDGTTVVDTLVGLRVWGSGTFAVGARVLVIHVGSRPVPFLFGGGGGGTGIGDPKCVVVADNGDGTYDVDLLLWSDGTTVVDTLESLEPWPVRKLFVGDQGYLKFDPAGSGAMAVLT